MKLQLRKTTGTFHLRYFCFLSFFIVITMIMIFFVFSFLSYDAMRDLIQGLLCFYTYTHPHIHYRSHPKWEKTRRHLVPIADGTYKLYIYSLQKENKREEKHNNISLTFENN